MIDIDRNNIMTDECIRNYRNFLEELKENFVGKGTPPLEGFEGWGGTSNLLQSINKIDRRQEDDPTYQGYYALESLERRRVSPPVFINSRRVEWQKYAARDLLGDALYY